MRIIEKIKYVAHSVKGDATLPEVVFWWFARVCFLCAVIVDDDPLKKVIFASNLLACFSYSLLRFVSPKESFIGRSSFHLQTLIVFTSFIGYFIGHATNIHDYVDKYDFVLHLVSGTIMVLMGYYLAKAVDKNKAADASMLTICSIGFSFMVIVVWEIFEFICDYYIPDSANQAYNWTVPDDFFLFRILGRPQAGEAQFPIFDTMVDIILAVSTTVVTGIVLFIVLKKKEEKAKKLKQS